MLKKINYLWAMLFGFVSKKSETEVEVVTKTLAVRIKDKEVSDCVILTFDEGSVPELDEILRNLKDFVELNFSDEVRHSATTNIGSFALRICAQFSQSTREGVEEKTISGTNIIVKVS